MPGPAPHPGLSQKSAALGGGEAQSAEVRHGSPRPPALPLPVLEPLLALLVPLAALLLDAAAPPAPPAPLLLAVLALPPAPLDPLLDAPPTLAEDEASPAPDEPLAEVAPAPVVEGSLSPQPRTSAENPVRTETHAMREAKRGKQGMIAIVPPALDRLART